VISIKTTLKFGMCVYTYGFLKGFLQLIMLGISFNGLLF